MPSTQIPGITETLVVAVSEKIATITLNRPRVLNALNHEQRRNLELAFTALEADPEVRVIILQGEGRAFCAGQDQKESAGMDARGAHGRIEAYASLYTTMRRASKPIIARIQGYATGAGLQLALLSDLRFASSDAQFGMTEFNVGSAAIMGSAFLRNVVGEANMKRLVMLSDFIPASQAKAMDLVTEVHEPDALDDRIRSIAAGLATRPPLGVTLTKEWWRIMSDESFDAAMAHARKAHARNFEAGGLSAGAAQFISRKKG